ncbi:cadmium-translocating P-type ATPase [Longibacter salinarum]|uniref:Cadmium-translocating P-type ATPase n=2 Tax=Longibacter salinarum TaxID=1850348 RepID=A0A2A8CUC3_9BACT|nr:cadmium-translocating P-type ATPase [Longibacter salinarum]
MSSTSPDLPEVTCAEAIDATAQDAEGLIRVELDTTRGRLALDYDRTRLSDREAERLVREMAAAIHQPMSACTMRLERRGGRSCETCALNLENRLRSVPGIQEAQASFRSGILRVTYDEGVTSPEDLVRTVHSLGESAALPMSDDTGDAKEAPVDRVQLRRESVFVALSLAGMVGGLVAGWLDLPTTVRWISYAVSYVFGGWYGLVAGLETLRHRAVDIDLLMILAAVGALAIGAPFEGAMLLFLFSLSNVLQHYAIGRSRRAIEALMTLRPEEAQVRRNGTEVTLPIEEVDVGDVFVVRPGDRVPLDGTVTAGESAVDQSALTGESVPVHKSAGDDVYGGTINEDGSLDVRVTRRATESAIARLISMVEHAQGQKAQTQRLIDRLEQPYVLGVLGLTVTAAVVGLLVGESTGTALYRAMTLMVAASPCAVVISTPAAVLSAIAAGARRGVLFKGGAHVEAAASVRAVAFDKTGTLTKGDTELTDLEVRPGSTLGTEELTETRLLTLAAAVQSRSEHHLARATVAAAETRGLDLPPAARFHASVGKGVRADVAGRTVHIGNPAYFESRDGGTITGLDEGLKAVREWQEDGKTSVLVAAETDAGVQVIGWIAYADVVRDEARRTVEALRAQGVEHIVMLTGDHATVARRIGEAVGVDEVYAELLPEQKVDRVRQLVARYGSVAMVGDGVNDAPALATATVGVAMGGAGTDVALETADLVLMGDDLTKLPYALSLSHATRRTLRVNLSIAFAAIIVMIATILTAGIALPLAVVGHEGSTVVVSLNGLRLLAFRE